jgi:hypothetical protein
MYAGAFRFGAYLIEIGDMEAVDVYRQVHLNVKVKIFCYSIWRTWSYSDILWCHKDSYLKLSTSSFYVNNGRKGR